MKRLCVIPARGGSKRVPRKNVLEFRGKPMVAYSIEAALEAGRFERVVVSTDDEEIAGVATRFGAEVDLRDPNLATDTATVNDVLFDLLRREEGAGRAYDVICCLFATAPLRSSVDVRAVVDYVEPGECDFAVAVTSFDLPAHQAMRMADNGELVALMPDLINTRASEVGEVRVDNGSTYAATVSAYREVGHFFGPGCRGHDMPRERSCDIDEPEDLATLEWYAAKVLPEQNS